MRSLSVGVFLRGGARPPTPELVAFINRNKDDVIAGRRLGVERICKVLQVALSTYYAANGRPASARQRRDAEIAPQLLEIWEANYSVYGAHKALESCPPRWHRYRP